MKDLLRDALPHADTELRRDLWPAMQARMKPARTLSHFDWALIAALLATIALFPHSLFILLYHL